MISKQYTCIVCPLGCQLTAQIADDGGITVSGNSCPRGAQYAKTELTAPVRTLTSTVRILHAREHMLPVKTSQPIPKEKMAEAMEQIKKMTVSAPVRRGDSVAQDFILPGVTLVAGCDIDAI